MVLRSVVKVEHAGGGVGASAEVAQFCLSKEGCDLTRGSQGLAEHVLERGHRLVATARKPELLKDLAERGDTLILPLDVTDATQVTATVKAAEDRSAASMCS